MPTNTITAFENETFGQVRTTTIDGEPWFVAKDVAVALGYANPQKALRDHVDEEDKGVNESFTPGGNQKLIVINESGLYSLILSSKMPNAKEFKRWVTHEVLPSIRKTGVYAPDSGALSEQETQRVLAALSHPNNIEAVLNQLKALQERTFLLESEVERVRMNERRRTSFINTNNACDLAASNTCVDFETAAAAMNTRECVLVNFCLKHRFLYRDEDGELQILDQPKDQMFVTETVEMFGVSRKKRRILITQEGRRILKILLRGL